MKKMIRQIMALATLCWVMASCSDDTFNQEYGEGMGRLLITDFKVNAIVGDIITKAKLDNIPETSEFTITIVDATTNDVIKELENGATECYLSAGSYIVKATYGEEKNLSSSPYFYGESEEVTIADGTTQSISLTASLSCAVIHPQIADKLASQYESYTLTISDDLSSETLTNETDYFVSGGKDKTYNLTFAGQNKLGESVSHTWNYSDLIPRTRYIIQCDPDLPSFTLSGQNEGDVWSTFMYITPMTAKNISYKPEGLTDEEILSKIKYEISTDGIDWTEAVHEGDKWIAKNLNPSTEYKLRSNFFNVYSNITTITTENAAEVPNGDFEELTETINVSNMNQGGKWNASAGGPLHQNTCSFIIKEPVSWTSVNAKTCNANAINKNSWFVIPSTYNSTLTWTGTVPDYHSLFNWGGGGTETPEIYKNTSAQNGINAMVIRNVAWDTNGISPSDDKKTATSSGYYNRNSPTIAQRSAGKLFLGSYSYVDGVENYDEGITFNSRPLRLEGFYKYFQDENDTEETGMVTVTVLSNSEVIGTGSSFLTTNSDYVKFNVPINYTNSTLKASELKIMITSSNHASYNQNDETNSIKTSIYNGRYESASRGAMLTIDNLTFSYEYNANNE